MDALPLLLSLFIGPQAKTWDAEKYSQAVSMRQAGADPETIRRATGIFWGPDGNPRTEIDDSKAEITGLNGTGPMNAKINHEELFRAYPDLKTLKTSIIPPFPPYDQYYGTASYNRPSTSGALPSQESVTVYGTQDNSRDLLIHELQHAIQQREGWQAGGDQSRLPIQVYRRLAGEAEARAAQRRRDLTPEQRGALPPLESYDIPLADQNKDAKL